MVTAAQIPEWLRPLYPFTPSVYRTASGAKLSYLDEGPREEHAILLLHGNPTWSFYYRNLIRELFPHRRCIVPDHIGMGLSDKPEKYDYTLAGRIADVSGLIEHLGLRQVDLVVHDWGGAIGFGWAVEHEPRVGKLVILNTAAFPSLRVPWRIAMCRWPGWGAWVVRGMNGFAAPATHLAMHRRELTRDERRAYLLPYDSWAHRVAVHQFVRDIPLELDHRSRPAIERIARELPRLALKPKLIGWGGKDFCFHDHFLARWRELYPQAEVAYYPEAGHYVLEDAGPVLTHRIRDFLLNP
jgi:pimeloyl-ACP methyl ester carboxylesterase